LDKKLITEKEFLDKMNELFPDDETDAGDDYSDQKFESDDDEDDDENDANIEEE
jgi:hypothetical protein